ncbi:hypothetical protein C2W59_02923 [Bacillus pumilus]|nr:hypothetical protein C2W59_02923 [Bacillus pumilus]
MPIPSSPYEFVKGASAKIFLLYTMDAAKKLQKIESSA